MCGLTGIISYRNDLSKELLQKMSNQLEHRGPDDNGELLIQQSGFQLGFAFRRLSIIDLTSAGHQPMVDNESECTLIFNGEIYNYKEIRAELMQSGYSFHSNSDSEVILKAYSKWGVDCVSRFIGMFAIAIYDSKMQKVVLFRDRFGVKPLYYYNYDGVFMFASELKSFHQYPAFDKSLSIDALSMFFKYDYIPDGYSIFKHCEKLKPGHLLEYNLIEKSAKTISYWDADNFYSLPTLNIDFNSARDHLEELLISAFNYRLVSDVPVGVFLSGGYDSSCVAALLQSSMTDRLRTFTIGFEEQGYNEAPYAKKVAEILGTQHEEYYCSYKEAIDLVPKLPDIYDEPFGDQSAIPTTLVSKIARQHVTVALSADGGDELFAGYSRHRKNLNTIKSYRKYESLIQFAKKIIPIGNHSQLSKTNRNEKLFQVLGSKVSDAELFAIFNQTNSDDECNFLLNNYSTKAQTSFNRALSKSINASTLKSILSTEVKTYLVDDILTKVDRATMSVSLEGREPFLDHRILEYVAQLPQNFLINDLEQKVILKSIVHKYLPKEIMERPKMGFGVPLAVWCKNEIKDIFDETILYNKTFENGILNKEVVTVALNDYHRGHFHNFQKLWNIFVFQQWYQKWM